jgi:hypothetical protein
VYRLLFDLAGYAIFAWLLVILLPGWRITRRVAESAVFPAYLAVLYVVGLVAVLRESGPGFMADFGSADGVLGLLAQEPVAIVAWIHILAFDQVVALLIYRDNMRHRFVPLPVQSLIMVATLMLGPVGFLAYWLVRVSRTRRAVAWGESFADDVARDGSADVPAPRFADVPAPRFDAVPAPRFADVVGGRKPVAAVLTLWQRERTLFGLAALGFTFAAVTIIIAAVNGGWLLGAEGRLLEAVKFDVAVGIYLLTLALIAPFAPVPDAARRRWLRWMVGLTVFNFAMENVQAWRGLDPRFSAVAGPVDQALGGLFFVSALGILVLFVDLLARFWSDDALPDHPALRLALRYGTVTMLFAFGIGVVMSMVGTRYIGAGNMMTLHAVGFHGLQAVPLVALLAASLAALTESGGVKATATLAATLAGPMATAAPTATTAAPMATAPPAATSAAPMADTGDAADAAFDPAAAVLGITHIAGIGWLLLCTGLLVQALAGTPLAVPAAGLVITVLGAMLWACAAAVALMRGGAVHRALHVVRGGPA